MSNIEKQLEFLKNKLLASNKRNIIKQLSVHSQSKFIDLYEFSVKNSYGSTIKEVEEKLILKGERILLLHANEQDDNVADNSGELNKSLSLNKV